MNGNNILAVAVLLLAVVKLSTQNVDEHLRFIFYPSEQQYSVQNLTAIYRPGSGFDRDKITVFYFYGLGQYPSTPEVQRIKNAYLSRPDKFNFILVTISSIYYTTVTAESVGQAAGYGIRSFIAVDGLMPKLAVEIVGFSLGAQIGALASRVAGGPAAIQMLVGLDPGRYIVGGQRLSRSDAELVVTVHTETKLYGDEMSKGHINFYMNGAISQHDCVYLLEIQNRYCSHKKAVDYWATGIAERRPAYTGRLCSNYQTFLAGGCDGYEKLSMNMLDCTLDTNRDDLVCTNPIDANPRSTLDGDYYETTIPGYPYSNVPPQL